MLNFLNNFSWLEKIGFFLFAYFLYSNIISFVRYRKTTFNLNNGNIPNCLENFPVHKTSPDAYLKSKSKVERFKDLALAGQKNKLQLSQNDLNNLYTKGITLNKSSPGRYLYYQIQDNVILEKLIEGFLFMAPKTYRTRVREVSFSSQESNGYIRVIEEYGRKMNEKKQEFPFYTSTLLLFTFGGLRSPDSTFYKHKETVEYQRAMALLEKIKSVEISNENLIFRT